MDAPSQNMNALSVQSLYYASDDALHEIDLRLLSRLPETLQLLQDQLRRLGAEPERERVVRGLQVEALLDLGVGRDEHVERHERVDEQLRGRGGLRREQRAAAPRHDVGSEVGRGSRYARAKA